MNITFLIGNGFDKGIGLNSNFTDFFPVYQKNSKAKKEHVKWLSDNIGKDYKTWADFERQIGRYTANFTVATKRILRDQLRDFETEFVEYLKEEDKMISFDNKDKIAKTMISALTRFWSTDNLARQSSDVLNKKFEARKDDSHRYNFISFNYTSTLEKCLATIPSGKVNSRQVGAYGRADIIGRIVHVHGKIDELPIMGLNDVDQIENKELAKDNRFIRYLVKPLLNEAQRTNQDKDASDLILNSHIIGVYGMSLGETDKLWWRRILDWLNASSDRHFVIFDYDEKFTRSSQFDWLEKEDSIIDKLAQYVKSGSMDIEQLRPQIHLAVHKNIFQMDLRKQESEENADVIDLLSARVNTLDPEITEPYVEDGALVF